MRFVKMGILFSLLTLAACATPDLVVMQNPQTHELAQCRHDPWRSIIKADVSQCVEGYKQLGWTTAGS
jgi:hypothetical protein